MNNHGMNPYLPSWEYVPDGEPHVFGNRVYVYGSHDRFNGYAFCLNDYVCWSAPVDDLTEWKFEGVIYTRGEDPKNADGEHCLYAPDVTGGPDGRYYLYYCLDGINVTSVAVSDSPAGPFHYYGDVHHPDGTLYGQAPGDGYQFDPGVLTEGGSTWLYTGFCPIPMKARTGAQVTELAQDMLTVLRPAKTIVPSTAYAENTSFAGHAFFEASSIRKVNGRYYFIYSSQLSHELCYATADAPDGPFVYGGTIISNGDVGFADTPRYFLGNDHGSIEEINGKWYVFHHRHTNGSSYSRQGCLEPIEILSDGSIPQVECTSSGPNGAPLPGKGVFPAYTACHLFMTQPPMVNKDFGQSPFPRITQDCADTPDGIDAEPAYISNLTPGVVAGFRYFDCKDIHRIAVKVRGKCYSGGLQISLTPDGEPLGTVPVNSSNEWHWDRAEIDIPDGVHALYFKAIGFGVFSFAAFGLE